MKKIDRDTAQALGLRRYFTGEPCRHDHVCERWTKNRECMLCSEVRRLRNKEYHRSYSEKLRREYPQRKAQECAAYRALHRATLNAQKAQYFRDHPEKRKRASPATKRANEATRRARKRSATGTHTARDLAEIRKMQKGRCAYCRCRLTPQNEHADHHIPLARKGANGRSNIQLLCSSCNCRKGAKDPIDFAQQVGLLL